MSRREVVLVVALVMLGGCSLWLAVLWKGEQDHAARLERALAAARTARDVTANPEVRTATPLPPSASAPAVTPEPPKTAPGPTAAPAPEEAPTPKPVAVPQSPAEIVHWLKEPREDEDAFTIEEELRARLGTDLVLRNDLLAFLSTVGTMEEFEALARFLAEELGDLAFPALERISTSHPDPARRRAALVAIGVIGSEPARRYLLDVLRTTPSDDGKLAAIEALGYPWSTRESDARQVVGALQGLMASRDDAVRYEGAEALLSWAHKPEHGALLAEYLTRETNEESKLNLMYALDGQAIARDPKVFQTVRRVFEDATASRPLREAAASILSDMEVLDDDLAKAIHRFWEE